MQGVPPQPLPAELLAALDAGIVSVTMQAGS